MALAAPAPAAGNVTDALAYVREVRDRFARQTGKYREFLAAMRDFKTGTCVRDRAATRARAIATTARDARRLTRRAVERRRLTPEGVIERVRRCLRGHDDLLDGFRAFLPEVRDARARATRERARRRARTKARTGDERETARGAGD